MIRQMSSGSSRSMNAGKNTAGQLPWYYIVQGHITHKAA